RPQEPRAPLGPRPPLGHSERKHVSGKRLVKGVMRAFSARLLGAEAVPSALSDDLTSATTARHHGSGGCRSVRPAVFSHAPTAVRTVDSASGGPMSWSPTGSPAAVKPQGSEIAGTPARLAGVV